MRKEKLVIKSEVEFRVEEEVKDVVAVKVKEIVEEMSAKYMRNIKVTVNVDVE